jgi:hypothetical protein
MKTFVDARDAIEPDWDLPAPYLTLLVVARADIDAYDHVNNAVYVTWFDRAAWEHSAALGLPIEKCLQLDRRIGISNHPSGPSLPTPCHPIAYPSTRGG